MRINDLVGMAFSLGHHGSTSGSEENEKDDDDDDDDDDEKTKRRALFIRHDMKRQLFSQPTYGRC